MNLFTIMLLLVYLFIVSLPSLEPKLHVCLVQYNIECLCTWYTPGYLEFVERISE